MTRQEKKDRNVAIACLLILLVLGGLKVMSVSPDVRKSMGFLSAFVLLLPWYIQLILAFVLFKVIGGIVKFVVFTISKDNI